nr:hypothetical protein [Tanacetum cinerariifolium]
MVAILKKGEHNVDFHPIVDFVEASPLRIETTEEGTKILATVDGILRSVTKSSLRRNLKLQDEEGIRFNEFSSNIAKALVCLATNKTYNFSKMIFDGLVKNVNNKGEGSGTSTEPHHTPSPEAHPTSHTTHPSPTRLPVTTASIPTVTPSETTPIRQYTRRARIAQSSALSTVADEPAFPSRDVCQGEACPTVSGFKADQDRANIAKTSTLPHDSAPRVTSPAAAEGRVGNQQGRNLDEGKAAAERVSDDTEEMATVLTSMDAASGVADVPTGNGSILTASPFAAEVPTGIDVVPTINAQVARDLEEKIAREDQRMSEQVAKDAEIARIHAEEELQSTIDGLDRINEIVAKYLQEYQQFASELPLERRIELISWKVKNFRGMTFEEIEAKFNTVLKQIKDFIPMGSKEEAKRLKRKGLSIEQESVKKLKTSEEVTEEAKSPDEVPEEKVKEMMQLVPIEEVYVEALQVKHPIIDWKVHIEGQRAYWKITRLGGSSASYQFFIDLLKHLDREDLNQLWVLVKESLSNRPPTSDKEMELWLYDTCGVHHVTAKDKEIFMLVEKDYPLRKGLAIGMISYKLQVENYSRVANDLILKIYKIASTPRQQGD